MIGPELATCSQMRKRFVGLSLTALVTACASGPRLEQPVGATHEFQAPPPAPVLNTVPLAPATSSAASKAPSTEPEYHVCELPDTATKAPHFPTNSFALRRRGRQILDQIAHCMLNGELEDKSVIVLGYADPRGSEAYNSKLAMQRALRVARYLIRRGVPANRVKIASQGDRCAEGKGPEGWQVDRRVEIEVDRGRVADALCQPHIVELSDTARDLPGDLL